ncbi:MAG: hypothetical protein IPH13_11070 [Planctomycetes bacterium]|nr:hypothetical protein [Planctomycetota bacterium]MCC7171177.1 hypothetical protein [Planctomycetota bacterium]
MLSRITWFLVALVVLSGGYLVWDHFTQQQRLVAEQQKVIEEKTRIVGRLTRARRVAQAIVKERVVDANGKVRSRIRFVEVDDEGKPLPAKTVEVEGEEVYFDALVLKFDHELVGAGEPGKEHSLLLFRRIFGEHQKPSEGARLDEDAKDGVPDVYRRNREPSAVEIELWNEFWSYANDPKKAAAAGVRVAQGEAPHTRMEKGKIYELTLDQSGGLNITVSELPAVLVNDEN